MVALEMLKSAKQTGKKLNNSIFFEKGLFGDLLLNSIFFKKEYLNEKKIDLYNVSFRSNFC